MQLNTIEHILSPFFFFYLIKSFCYPSKVFDTPTDAITLR